MLDALNSTTIQQWASELTDGFHAPTPFAVALLVGSLALLFLGATLVRATFFLASFVISALAAYYVSRAALAGTEESVACYGVASISLAVGILAGFAAIKLLRLAFACVGTLAGGALGLFLYGTFLSQFSTDVLILGHDATFWACVLLPALVGAALMLRWQHQLLIIATAVAGAVGLVPSLAMLVFVHIDSRFLWILSARDDDHLSSPFVYGQAAAAVLYAAVGVVAQQAQERRKKSREAELREPLIRP